MTIALPIVQLIGFSMLAIIYGGFGSPTPDDINTTELLVLISLCLVIGIKGLTSPLTIFKVLPTLKKKTQHPIFWLYLLFLWGTLTSIATGLFYGQPVYMVIRDYAGFLMLCAPIFFLPYIRDQQTSSALQYTIITVALLFALRVIYDTDTNDTGHANALYLSISPTILFAGCFLLMNTLYFLCLHSQHNQKMSVTKKILLIVSSAAGTFLIADIMFASQMRAGIGALLISAIALNLWAIIFRPRRALLLIMYLGITLITTQEFWQPLINVLWDKQQTVNFNLRSEELTAVTKEIDHSLVNQLIGLGWGAGIESPSSKGNVVNFTHSLFSSLWLKTGSVGVLLMVACLLSIMIQLARTLKLNNPQNIILAVALILCISINILLYGGYKSLGFGLCLTLLISLCFTEETRPNLRHPIA